MSSSGPAAELGFTGVSWGGSSFSSRGHPGGGGGTLRGWARVFVVALNCRCVPACCAAQTRLQTARVCLCLFTVCLLFVYGRSRLGWCVHKQCCLQTVCLAVCLRSCFRTVNSAGRCAPPSLFVQEVCGTDFAHIHLIVRVAAGSGQPTNFQASAKFTSLGYSR